jgi:branched-chain amino acid transport system ATP-binding protein
MHNQNAMLKVDNACISYGAIEAVKGISLHVSAGEVVCIIGANGAGKTTLMKGIVGLEPLSGGRVEFDGKDITRVPAHKRTGMGIALSPEGRGVFADQTVLDNLLLGAQAKKLSREELASRIAREFERFPRLKERQAQIAGTLSGGEQQMLAISRALMSDPKLLLLDEPSLGLAPIIIEEIFQSIRQLSQSGLTIVLVEQMANQALAASDRAYVLETGHITIEGKGQNLLNDPKVRAAYLGG